MPDRLQPEDSEDVRETPEDPGEFVPAVVAENQVEAQLLVAICEQAGIPVILQSSRSGPVDTISSPVEGFNLLVPRRDLDRALKLLEERKEALEADPEGAARAAEEEEARGEQS